jgi:hypothetical protein
MPRDEILLRHATEELKRQLLDLQSRYHATLTELEGIRARNHSQASRHLVRRVLDAMSPQSVIDRPPLFPNEVKAIASVIDAARQYGFGNLIAWLQTAWALELRKEGLSDTTAIEATSNRSPYPLPPR